MTVSEWFELRQHFSHDILINRVLNAFRSRHHEAIKVADISPYMRLFIAQEQSLLSFLQEAPVVLKPGTWLVNWMGNNSEEQADSVLSEFLNLDFFRTSSLPGKCYEIIDLLDCTLAAARRVLESRSIDIDDCTNEVEALLEKLSVEFTKLPSSMLQVVETMR